MIFDIDDLMTMMMKSTKLNKIYKISKFKNFEDCEPALTSDFEDWKGEREQTDDVIIVGIRF